MENEAPKPEPFADQLAQFVAQHPVVIPSDFDRLLDDKLKREGPGE